MTRPLLTLIPFAAHHSTRNFRKTSRQDTVFCLIRCWVSALHFPSVASSLTPVGAPLRSNRWLRDASYRGLVGTRCQGGKDPVPQLGTFPLSGNHTFGFWLMSPVLRSPRQRVSRPFAKNTPSSRRCVSNTLCDGLKLTDASRLAQITAWVDEGLDEKRFIVPGLGDFGDR